MDNSIWREAQNYYTAIGLHGQDTRTGDLIRKLLKWNEERLAQPTCTINVRGGWWNVAQRPQGPGTGKLGGIYRLEVKHK